MTMTMAGGVGGGPGTWNIYIIYIYISPFKGVLAALSFKKLMASLISQDSVVGKYSSGEYPREATPENCCSGFWCSYDDISFYFERSSVSSLVLGVCSSSSPSSSSSHHHHHHHPPPPPPHHHHHHHQNRKYLQSKWYFNTKSNFCLLLWTHIKQILLSPPYQLSQMPAPSHENHWSHWPGTASPPTFQPETRSDMVHFQNTPHVDTPEKLTAGTEKWSFNSDDFLFISKVIFWIQHSSETSCIETLPFIPAQDMLGLSSNLLWFCVEHPFSSTQKTNTWNQLNIDPWKLTWNLKIIQLKRKLIFRTSILVFHVNFSGDVTKPPFPSRLIRVNLFKVFLFPSNSTDPPHSWRRPRKNAYHLAVFVQQRSKHSRVRLSGRVLLLQVQHLWGAAWKLQNSTGASKSSDVLCMIFQWFERNSFRLTLNKIGKCTVDGRNPAAVDFLVCPYIYGV